MKMHRRFYYVQVKINKKDHRRGCGCRNAHNDITRNGKRKPTA